MIMKNNKKLAQIIRVNHAGEFGAKVIYEGQLAALKLKNDQESIKLIEHMKEQELEHLDYFNKAIINQKVRPTIMQPIWHVGGFAMGFLTALLDKRAAMCCTTAVEEVIDEHYQDQLKFLAKEQEKLTDDEKKETKELEEKIEKFRAEEIEHRDIGYDNKAKELPYFTPLSTAIKCATKFAIFVSKKI